MDLDSRASRGKRNNTMVNLRMESSMAKEHS